MCYICVKYFLCRPKDWYSWFIYIIKWKCLGNLKEKKKKKNQSRDTWGQDKWDLVRTVQPNRRNSCVTELKECSDVQLLNKED